MVIWLDSRSRSTSVRNTASAIGDRQMLPVQTNNTLAEMPSSITSARRPPWERLGSVIVPVNREGGVLHQPIDQKRPDTTNKRKEHPPIRSDVQGGALAANSGLVHEVCAGDDCNCMR